MENTEIMYLVVAVLVASVILGIQTVLIQDIKEVKSSINAITQHLGCTPEKKTVTHKIISAKSLNKKKYKDKGIAITMSPRARKYVDENKTASEVEIGKISQEVYDKYKDQSGCLESKWVDVVDGKLAVVDKPVTSDEHEELLRQLAKLDFSGLDEAIDTLSGEELEKFETALNRIEKLDNPQVEDCKYVLNKIEELSRIQKELLSDSSNTNGGDQ